MKLSGRIVAITGGGAGLGAQACRIARERGAARIGVIDLNAEAAEKIAAEVGGIPITADVTDEAQIRAAVDQLGGVDIWVHNAGIGAQTTPFSDDGIWQRMWDVHVMGVVYATRALLPAWIERGEGHFAMVASANALTTNPMSAAYAASKHAELALAEWMAMTYGPRGVITSCFCPKGMLTPMLIAHADDNEYVRESVRTAVTSEAAATMLIDLIESDRFLSTTYPPVMEEYALRATDPDAYIAGLQDTHRRLVPGFGLPATS
ncbi:SDR family oxidoreductase [Rhodococcus sp. WAY2]|uniref:SDR family oxidoreductase n=1 Tax=Rhodococcus sp. WAY2 TaxID=2663121 RepID=UPI00131F6999|nr:SDR family oxidoreductase [Rhodococcus sp. WAY2]QHE70319.1 putative oxidoreductase [Rhodococcus sp. WAY2]